MKQGVTLSRPDVFKYVDHRKFLRDWVNHLKNETDGLSLRGVARSAGLSPGLLPLILNSDRKLSHSVLEKLVPVLKLSAEEIFHLEQLRTLNESEVPEVRTRAFHQINSSSKFRKLNPKEAETYKYLSHWYYVAIRELASIPGFQNDVSWIQGRLQFKVNTTQVQEAIEFLFNNGFLLSRNGKITVSEKNVECMEGFFRMNMGQFHMEMLQLGQKSIASIPRDKRFLNSHTLAVDDEGLSKVKEIIAEAIKKISEISIPEKKSANVYHIEVASFPLTHSGEEKSK